MRFLAGLLAILFVAIAAVPTAACPMHARDTHSMAGTHRDRVPAPAHVCIGCATMLPDSPRPAADLVALAAPAPTAVITAEPAGRRPGFEPPPPRPSV